MLSISGLHVAVIAAAMELLFQVARMSRRASLLGAFIATGVYVAVIGAPPPALRSAAMLGVSMASRLSQRPTSPWAAWALGAFVPLVQPRVAVDVGYQLSVLGMCALVAA
jgi:competence protein ComEC